MRHWHTDARAQVDTRYSWVVRLAFRLGASTSVLNFLTRLFG
jgi:hypothetical protein